MNPSAASPAEARPPAAGAAAAACAPAPRVDEPDLELARYNMIEQQIRPWDVLDQTVLDVLRAVPREDFVAPAYRRLAFADLELPLIVDGGATGQKMLAPKVAARLLQELALRPDDRVLEVGAGSGYVAALLARQAREVLAIEIDERLARLASANLARAGIDNARVMVGDGACGWPDAAPFDAILLSGSVPALPPRLSEQLNVGGRLAAIVGTEPVMTAWLITRTGERSFQRRALFETCVAPLRNAWRPSSFRFE